MSSFKQKKQRKGALIIMLMFCLVLGLPSALRAEFYLTPEEKDYIALGKVIKAASIIGGAPLHYLDSKGEITGIAVRVLDDIADKTGLIFEYYLYESIEAAFNSNPDILFGVTTNYAPADMILSRPYLKSETILCFNSSLNPAELEDKTYAGIKGGNLPEGVREENTLFYGNREETLDALEVGEADYAYGNAYSIAFYTLQNAYKNIVTIPKGKEPREYCIGFPQEDELLLSIINKSIEGIDDSHMQTLILDVASKVDRKITMAAIMDAFGKEISVAIILVMGVLLFSMVSSIRANRNLRLENKRYEILSQTSGECLYEYSADYDQWKLSDKFKQKFGVHNGYTEIAATLKSTLFNYDENRNVSVLRLPLANGEIGVFKAINSNITDSRGKTIHIIGKLVDISEEMAEKEQLIVKSQIDGLTGLYNATTARQLITKSMKNRDKHKKDALIMMDCDSFKHINDTYGHLKGDEVLQSISESLKLVFRQTDCIGRVGGDEFCVYMKDVPSLETAKEKCRQLAEFIGQQNIGFPVSISCGIALINEESTFDELFKKADLALYQAKGNGKGEIVVYSENEDE